MKEEGGKTKAYIKDTIKSLKSDPPDRVERNVDSALSKMKSAGAVVAVEDLFWINGAVDPQKESSEEGEEKWTQM